jgi:hypothetical protein
MHTNAAVAPRELTTVDQSERSVNVARGLMLLGVFHVHAVYVMLEFLGDPASIDLARLQVKLLTGFVVLFFALSGMTSGSLQHKPWGLIVQRSVWLLVLAAAVNSLAVLIEHALWHPWKGIWPIVKDVAKPVVLGTGHTTFAWYFVVLAVVRLAAFALARSWLHFLGVSALAVAAIAATKALALPDNLFEWRVWPAAIFMFAIGQRLPANLRVPHWVGAAATVSALLLPLLNHPSLPQQGPCLACDLAFVAEPAIGRWGWAPVFLLQTAMALIGLLWLSQMVSALPLGRFLAWLGRRSIPMLVLHSWVVVSIYGVIGFAQLHSAGPALFAVLFLVNALLHVALYRLLRRPLDHFVALCAGASRRIMGLMRRL